LVRINRILGSEPWFRRELRRRVRPGERILELGAGTGEMGIRLAAAGVAIDGLDLWPRPAAWPGPAHWHQADVRTFAGYEGYPVVIANLLLHQFSAEDLAAVGRRIGGARLIIASEPARRRRSQALFAALAPVLGANHVTRHDGRVSIAAGFVGEELPAALGLAPDRWAWSCRTSWLGAYRMIAVRRLATAK
jgi:predicted amidohydrolase